MEMRKALWYVAVGIGAIALITYVVSPISFSNTIAQWFGDGTPVRVSGIILANVSADGGMPLTYFDLSSGLSESSSFEHWFMPISSDDEGVYLTSSMLQDDEGVTHAGIVQLRKGGDSEEIVYASSTIPYFMHPRIAPQGAAYSFEVPPSQGPQSDEWNNPDEWQIYIGVLGGEEVPTFVDYGAHVSFSPDGSQLVYLTRDGVKSYNLLTGEGSVVLRFAEGSHRTNNTINLSRDGSLLAVSNPAAEKLTIWRVQSWFPFTLGKVEQVLNVQALWPVFSPDGTQIASVGVAWETNNGVASVQSIGLVAFDIKSKKVTAVVPLNTKEASGIIISDWVAE